MNRFRVITVILVAGLLIVGILIGLLGDLFWFSSVGYESVFVTILITRFILFILAFGVFFGFSYGNAVLAARNAGTTRTFRPERLQFVGIIAGMGSLLAAMSVSGFWETILKFINQTTFAIVDPLFGLDVGFYIFALPFYSLLVNFLLVLFIFTAILSAVSFFGQALGIRMKAKGSPYVVVEGDEAEFDWTLYFRQFLPHLSVLLFLIFVVLAARLWLSRYNLLLSTAGTVFGPGYTDVNVTLPVLSLLAGLALVIGVGFLVNEKFRRIEVITYGIAAFGIIAVIGIIAGAAVQGLIVEPNEFNLEKEYLEENIGYTLAAYGLDEADEQIFLVNYTLTPQDIRANAATVENIRLWDWRPLKSTYEQLQLFRTYYQFNDIDVDRYHFDGMYREVLISAREMNTFNLPEQAQTWVNQHLVYTHGYGAVMNPVDEVSPEGLPVFFLKDIPPVSQYITLDEPRIYYGENPGDYVVTQTSTDEFDYPAGEQNFYRSYEGTGGVPLSDWLRKVVYGVRFGSIELLISGSLTPESKVLLHRNVKERVETIAPFLSYDPDPYVVAADGRLYWIIDAYTTADRYPYSEPVRVASLKGQQINYIRNSVKVVVDAFNGDVNFYIVDPDDPLITAYEKMFPGIFRNFDEMPASLREHVRYPQGIFEVQANLYATYHMKDPRVFYNKEDAWVIPDEIYRESRQQMEPYYIIMKLPGEETEEFILMLPFTPRNKENMIGWMAARSDVPNYGGLIVYQFSKQELTYGPMQIEARIDQDTEISQRITLWSQSGSSVLRGNTLIIPIENSIIYVEPLFLEATERGTLPQLQRVIVAYNDRLTMQKTLSEALAVIFGEGAGTPPDEEGAPPISEEDAEKLARIAGLYDLAQQALAEGDLGSYQQYIDEIGRIAAS